MTEINGIPVYEALLGDEGAMTCVSLVDSPAVLTDFQVFDEKHRLERYAVADDEKRLVWGVLMRADFPIYRRDARMGEYYIIYSANTIREMAEKYLAQGLQNTVNEMHEDGSEVSGVEMVQMVIQDHSRGIVPTGFDDIADGSLFAEYHVLNDEVWAKIKDGTFKGFSIECYIELAPASREDAEKAAESENFTSQKQKISMTSLKQKAIALLRAIAKFGAVSTDKGLLVWDGEDEPAVGLAVFVEDSEGNRTPAEDGEYALEDGTVLVVADGKISEIREAEEESAEEPNVEAAEEPAPEQEPEAPADNDIERRLSRLESELEQIANILGLVVVEQKKQNACPAGEDAHEAFKKVNKGEAQSFSDIKRKFIKR